MDDAASAPDLRSALDNITDGIFSVDRDFVYTYVNQAGAALVGRTPEQLVGRCMWNEFPEAKDSIFETKYRQALSGQRTITFEEYFAPLGAWFSIRVFPSSSGLTVIYQDTTEQHEAHDRLTESEQRYRLLAENATDVVWQLDTHGIIRWVSPSVVSVLGWTPQKLLGTNVRDLIHPEDREITAEWKSKVLAGRTVPSLESRRLTADGEYRWMSLQARPLVAGDGSVTGLVVGTKDIDGEVRARAALAHAIEHDPLTGLATAPVAVERIGKHLEDLAERPQGHAVGVLCVGIDGLKPINEALTHAAGDRAIIEVATRIATVVDDPDLLARGSGDEFVVIQPNLINGADAGPIAERICQTAHGTVTIGSAEFALTVTIGIASGVRGDDPDDLLRNAALAMRHGKDNGRDRCEFFQESLSREAERRISIEEGIRRGLEHGQFVPWFQHVVNLDTEDVVGYEALLRWVQTDGTVISPEGFIPVAERTSLIRDLDTAVLNQSLETLSRLSAPLHVAVNVSATTLLHADFGQSVIDAISRTGADPARLRLEITETVLLDYDDQIRSIMDDLAALGVRWYVDDFGTGHSSISHLRDLPVAGLKLDLSFTAGIRTGDRTSERLALALAGLAAGLGLETIAEGVETREEAAVLRAQGWKHAQGWLFGRAQPAATL